MLRHNQPPPHFDFAYCHSTLDFLSKEQPIVEYRQRQKQQGQSLRRTPTCELMPMTCSKYSKKPPVAECVETYCVIKILYVGVTKSDNLVFKIVDILAKEDRPCLRVSLFPLRG